jgi:hypothetical protein
MTLEIGVNHKCLNQHPDKANSGVMISPHTYDSGYLRLQLSTDIQGLDLGAVRGVFGENKGSADRECKEPVPLGYPTRSKSGPNIFFLDYADFRPSRHGYEAICMASLPPALHDSDPVGEIMLVQLEDDHTLAPLPVVY